ncbi:hypothetical protein NU195Hw_g4514t1 [Hortaea werneckii]
MSDLATAGLGVDMEGLRLRGQDNDAVRSEDSQTIAHSSAESEYVADPEAYREAAIPDAIYFIVYAIVNAVVATAVATKFDAVLGVLVAVLATLVLELFFMTVNNRALFRFPRDI